MLTSAKISNGINGIANIPGDKSISHRAVIISSIANGISKIANILKSEDVLKTINAFKSMKVKIIEKDSNLIIYGKGLNSLLKPTKKINLGNSGTSARLLIGLLSAQQFESDLYGDNSLSNRPMDRIINPLQKMGANILSKNKKLPINIKGQKLKNIRYNLEIPSAQIKSGIAFAALFIDEITIIIEKYITRDHTEKILKLFNADIKIKKFNGAKHIFIRGQKELTPKNIKIPSDFSSAVFFIVAAMINENSYIKMKNINLNPTRIGFLKAIKYMGGNLVIKNKQNTNGEITGDIHVKSSELKGCKLNKEMAKLMIDEYPILSIAASFAKSPSLFKGLKELRVKESDRLELIRYNLNICGIYCKIIKNDLLIDPTKKFFSKKNIIKTNNDHRIAMAFAIMGTKLGKKLKIQGSKYIKTSFPEFINEINSLGGNLSE